MAALVLIAGVFVVPELTRAEFTEPGTTPLTGNPPTFLNGSSVTQTKTGSLLIGPNGGSSMLCLNADTSKSIRDPANATTCIDAWADIASFDSFVRRQQNTVPSNPLLPSTYGTADRGYATVIGNATSTCDPGGVTPCNQGISTVVKVNTASTATPRYAVYATDGGSNTRGAAQLSGRTLIITTSGMPRRDHELCLNGQCIITWSDIYGFGNAGIIRLQNTQSLKPDIGNASVSGATIFTRGVTIGRPSATTATTETYGDGQCTPENGEDETNSPNDCN